MRRGNEGEDDAWRRDGGTTILPDSGRDVALKGLGKRDIVDEYVGIVESGVEVWLKGGERMLDSS